MKENNFYVVFGWMRSQLKLKGFDVDVYAIIYGFSQAENQKFTGSLRYLCDTLCISKPTVIKSLQSLIEKDLIIKTTEIKNNVSFNSYEINKNFTGGKETLLGVKNIDKGSKVTLPEVVKKLYWGSKETLPNNIDNNIINNKECKKEKNHTSFLTDDTAETYETQKPTETAQISTIIPKDVQTYQNDILSQYRPPYEPKKQFNKVGDVVRKIKEEHSIDWDTFKIGCSIKNDSSMLNSAMKNWWEDRVVVRDWGNKQGLPFRDWEAVYKDIKNFIRHFAKLYYK
jgi:hypothetical protein